MRLSRSPAGIPHGVGFVNPFPLARMCDLDCISHSVEAGLCQFEVCFFSFFSLSGDESWLIVVNSLASVRRGAHGG